MMRNDIIEASRAHFLSHIAKHRVNVEVMLNNPIAIHEHSDILGAIEKELEQIAEYEDKLEVLNKYFGDLK